MDLITQLKRDEGEVLHVYPDSQGIATAGVGHNLPAHGINLPVGTPITQAQCDQWLSEDINAATNTLVKHLPWVTTIDLVRHASLINMTFNMGIFKLLTFHHFLGYMESHSWNLAALAARQSVWFNEVGARAVRICQQIETGQWV